jgi:hypothetical protein
MPDWNSSPPRGHPMEPGKWPGTPLYPPAASPAYTPSQDSDFVIAVKRACAHLGAWPWDPPSWDDSYSNGFAYGSSRGPGVVAVQRWSGTLTPTGFVGEKTYNFLRSVLIQQGRTHAGEPAWDSVCVNLTAAAYEDAHPPPAPQTPLRARALEAAIDDLGIKESPPESNRCKFTDWYGMVGPWCAMAVTYWYELAGDSPTFVKGSRYAYVPYIVSDARNGRYGLAVTSNPSPGDLVCFSWGGSTAGHHEEYDHIGLFEKWVDPHYSFTAIEGNTSTSNNSNGGEVMRRTRTVNGQGTTFVRVAE